MVEFTGPETKFGVNATLTVGVLASLRDHRHLFADLDDAVAHARSHVARAAL